MFPFFTLYEPGPNLVDVDVFSWDLLVDVIPRSSMLSVHEGSLEWVDNKRGFGLYVVGPI